MILNVCSVLDRMSASAVSIRSCRIPSGVSDGDQRLAGRIAILNFAFAFLLGPFRDTLIAGVAVHHFLITV